MSVSCTLTNHKQCLRLCSFYVVVLVKKPKKHKDKKSQKVLTYATVLSILICGLSYYFYATKAYEVFVTAVFR